MGNNVVGWFGHVDRMSDAWMIKRCIEGEEDHDVKGEVELGFRL